jgi:peptidyl-prolyl cis-trans isomerase B (cyclophilin B)
MKIQFVSLLLVIGFVFNSCTKTQEKNEPVDVLKSPTLTTKKLNDSVSFDKAKDTSVITSTIKVVTSKGTFEIGLYGNDAPKTVKNIEELVKIKYYDGMLIHRIAKGFVIQFGDPNTKDASKKSLWGVGGQTWDTNILEDELYPQTPSAQRGYEYGVVAMATTGVKNSATSQFFICLESAAQLPFLYPIFGKVTKGLEIIKKIAISPTEENSQGGIPIDPIIITSITIQK